VAYKIKCTRCGEKTKAKSIVHLLTSHMDGAYFVCGKPECRGRGYIEKQFTLQERDQEGRQRTERWYLRGAICLGDSNDTYQPFIFLVNKKPSNAEPTHLWFCYYKDLRRATPPGRLKFGYGPGGPPILKKRMTISLIHQLLKLNFLRENELQR
jgi:hypothetical protein